MDYNPYTKEKGELQNHCADMLGNIQALENKIHVYERTNVNELIQELQDSRELLKSINGDIKIKSVLKDNYKFQHNYSAEMAMIAPLFPNPFSLFSKKAREDKKRAREAKQQVSDARKFKESQVKAIETELLSLNRHKTKLLTTLDTLKQHIDDYKQSNLSEMKDQLYEKKEIIKPIQRKQKIVNRKWGKANEAIEPIASKIKEKLAEKDTLEASLRGAEDFNRRLETASNSRDRAIIHQECEQAIGYSSPKKFISSQRRKAEALDRDIDKLQKRARQLASNLTKTFDTIIVDGNNLCYESGSFIGLAPIHAFLSAIDSVHTVLIVFDANIRSQLQIDNSSLQKLIGSKADTHVVANKQKADETIIALASRTCDTYILSNDRFVDYFDKEPVEQDRLIRHEVFDGSLIIHDLGIHQRY